MNKYDDPDPSEEAQRHAAEIGGLYMEWREAAKLLAEVSQTLISVGAAQPFVNLGKVKKTLPSGEEVWEDKTTSIDPCDIRDTAEEILKANYSKCFDENAEQYDRQADDQARQNQSDFQGWR